MKFAEMRALGRDLADKYRHDPEVKLVAGLRLEPDETDQRDIAKNWAVYVYPKDANLTVDTQERLEGVYQRNVPTGSPKPWLNADHNEAVFFVRPIGLAVEGDAVTGQAEIAVVADVTPPGSACDVLLELAVDLRRGATKLELLAKLLRGGE